MFIEFKKLTGAKEAAINIEKISLYYASKNNRYHSILEMENGDCITVDHEYELVKKVMKRYKRVVDLKEVER